MQGGKLIFFFFFSLSLLILSIRQTGVIYMHTPYLSVRSVYVKRALAMQSSAALMRTQ